MLLLKTSNHEKFQDYTKIEEYNKPITQSQQFTINLWPVLTFPLPPLLPHYTVLC